MLRRFLRSWADAALRAECAELKAKLAAAQAECESLALVVARDRERIKSELAAYARQRADAEGSPDERRAV